MMPAAVVYSAAVNLAFALLSMVQRRSSNSSSHIERPLPSITMAQRSAAQQNQTTRVAIVTGSNTGIGYETARSLVVDYGYTVILACRSRDKAETAAVRINKLEQQQRSLTTTVTATATATALTPTDTPASTTTKGGRAVFVHPLDLSSLDSVREFCAALKLHYPQQNIDVLINNAGRSTNGSSSSSLISGTTSGEKRNLDLLFQSNFLGHFLLTSLLLEHNHSSNNNCVTVRPSDERKIEAPHFRIVNLSSVMHHFCGGNMSIVSIGDDLESADFWKNAATAGQDPTDTYALSKLAALLFTIELNRRYGAVVDDDDDDGRNKNSNNKQHNVRSFAVNPGSV